MTKATEMKPRESRLALLRRLLRGNGGQAMAEYVTTSTILILGALAGGAGWPFFTAMINALDSYLSSIYYTLNLALP